MISQSDVESLPKSFLVGVWQNDEILEIELNSYFMMKIIVMMPNAGGGYSHFLDIENKLDWVNVLPISTY